MEAGILLVSVEAAIDRGLTRPFLPHGLGHLLGLQVPASWQGASLVPIIDDPQPPPRLVVSYLGDGSRAAIVGDYKLIVGPVGGRAGWEQLFDLARDPRETVNLAERGGVALRIVRTALLWQQQAEGRWKRARWGDGANLAAAFALDHGM